MTSQALLMAQNDYGPYENWDIGPMGTSQSSHDFLKKYLSPYMKSATDIQDSVYNGTNMADLNLMDGSILHMHIGACYDFYYDTNGNKPPNAANRDVFKFILCQPAAANACGVEAKFTPFWCVDSVTYPPQTREELLSICKGQARACELLLQYDNWEFKDDYPYKL